MLSSNSSCNQHPIPNFTPFPENDPSNYTSPFFPVSPQMHSEYLQFLDLFHHHLPAEDLTAAPRETPEEDEPRGANAKTTMTKSDRHSKINTARGPRDRRMRLSLDVARKFFDLQDLLGFDKASRTVEWLLRNSEPAIDELARAHSDNNNVHHANINPSSESCVCEEECEVVTSAKKSRAREKVKREVGRRATVGRESRRKARERARERTSQKRRLVSEEVIIGSHGYKESNVAINEHLSSDEAQILESTWNASAVFDYQEDDAVFLNQEEQIPNFQFSPKPWEIFDGFNLS